MSKTVSVKRLEAILAAEKEGRLVIIPRNSDLILYQVEKALGFELYDWQKAYIIGESDWVMPGRGNGRTTAYILRTLLRAGEEPIKLWEKQHVPIRFTEIYEKLTDPKIGLKVRKVFFEKSEWLEYLRKSAQNSGHFIDDNTWEMDEEVSEYSSDTFPMKNDVGKCKFVEISEAATDEKE